MKEAVIVSSVRTAVGKAGKGTLHATRPDDLAATAIRGALDRVPGLDPKEIDDVILGCAMPEAEQGMNVARIAALRAGLPVELSAMTINRFCSSGLQSIAMAAERIMCGHAEVIVAGGTESMSMVPMGGNKVAPNPWLMDHYPDTYLEHGTHRRKSRAQIRHHPRAGRPVFLPEPSESAGRHRRRKIPRRNRACRGAQQHRLQWRRSRCAHLKTSSAVFAVDEGPRADTSLEALARLKPAFHAHGTVTAGNSSQMSDGAAVSVVMSADRARALGLQPLARFLSFATAGYAPEEMGIGPVFAIPKALKMAGLDTRSDRGDRA